jgi:threonine/homoserine/homoserine lactone efflux protein
LSFTVEAGTVKDMPTEATLIAFTIVAACLMPVPGPSNVFLLTHGIAHGRRPALAATAGIEAAAAVRVLVAATGLSALIASSPAALTLIKWVGAAYLAMLGIRALRERTKSGSGTTHQHPVSPAHSARRGLFVGLANPKMLIFFLAFFPQFIHPSDGSETHQILVLGAVFWTLGALWDVALACAAGAIGGWLERRPGTSGGAQPRIEGATYLGLAGWVSLSGG